MQAKKSSATLNQLLHHLNDGAWHDGNALGQQLSVSRTAIWKAIKRLQAYGVEIECQSVTGYRLAEPIILLNEQTIRGHLKNQTECEPCHVSVFETLDSTNQYLAIQGKTLEQGWQVCVAEHQSHGRGRLGRQWLSPFAKNIYCSCLFSWPHDLSRLGGMSLLVALAINDVISTLVPSVNCQVKWPNDVLVDGAKLAGTLLEVVAEANGRSRVIMGMGININSQASDQTLDRPWTSLRQLTGQTFDRNAIVAQLLTRLHDYLRRFEHAAWPAFIEEWQRFDGLHGKLITVTQFNNQFQGLVQGVNDQGHLLLQTAGGEILAVSSGETTVVNSP